MVAGPLAMSQVRPGDLVASMGPDGTLRYSPVLLMLHSDPNPSTYFVHLETESGRKISVTTSHLIGRSNFSFSYLHNNNNAVVKNNTARNFNDIYDSNIYKESLKLENIKLYNISKQTFNSNNIEYVYADRIEEGDSLLVDIENNKRDKDHDRINFEKVIRVSVSKSRGIYAPLTAEGNMVVDGIVVSCYAVIDSQKLAHWAFLPVRVYYQIKRLTLSIFYSIGFNREGNLRKNNEWKPRKSSPTIVKFNESINETSIADDTPTRQRFVESVGPHIHWYPRMLYWLAELLLPSHLVHQQ